MRVRAVAIVCVILGLAAVSGWRLQSRSEPVQRRSLGESPKQHTAAFSRLRRGIAALLPDRIPRQVVVAREILQSHDDNDPRIDSELRGLSPEARALLRAEYASLPKEQLNSRGLLVFLLGRDLESQDDLEFLGRVLQETPCLSERKCDVRDVTTDPHTDSLGRDVTLAYPQLTALLALQSLLRDEPSHRLADDARSLLAQLARSPSPLLRSRALQSAQRHD